MSLSAGTRLGPFEIVAPLGSGGMGEVYRARDTKLNRDVALKVLPDEFARDPDRVARFKREAQLLASLNHPHIAAIHGLEESTGVQALILELVEGETLADRIAAGPIPLDEALPIARQVTDALEAAHERGVIHRDLKPANIKLKSDGTVKVLDFGLAKLTEPAAASSGAALLSQSPTITAPAMTQVGVILGTAAYMSPEQAKGRPADKRADIWAFGAVLYQMLTGRRAFSGASISDVLAAVVHAEPDWSALPASTPTAIRRLLTRCLEKDPKRRLPDIGVARLEIDDAATPEPAADPPPADRRRTKAWITAALIGAAFTGGILGALVWNLRSPKAAAPAVARFAVVLDDAHALVLDFTMMALSPDGSQIVFATNHGLFLRSMSELTARAIPGTEIMQDGLSNPVFSPDGQSIAYFSAGPGNGPGAVMKIAVTGGTAVRLFQMDFPPYGMSWGSDGIVLARSFSKDRKGVVRVSPSGAPPELLVAADDEFFQGPSMLPDGQTLLLTVATGGAADRWDNARIVAHMLKSGERKTLIEGGSDARYLPTGHIVYARGSRLFAVAFDLQRLNIVGNPVPVIEDVSRSPSSFSGAAHFATSGTGSLLYASTPRALSDLALIDRRGVVQRLTFSSGPYELPRLSPDGARVAVGTDTGDEADIWIGDLKAGGSLRRLTFGGKNRFPVWSADGRGVTYQSDRDGDLGVFWQAADGTGAAERLTTARPGTSHEPESWSPSGDHLLFRVTSGSRFSLWTFSLKDRSTMPFGAVEGLVPSNAMFSPDGRWVAYMAREGEKFLLYAQPFPPTGAKYQVADGGIFPSWSRDGRELYYFHGTGQLVVVNVIPQPVFTVGAPIELWNEAGTKTRMAGSGPSRGVDPTHDDKFLATVLGTLPSAATRIHVVLNWQEELKQRVPTK